MGWGGDWVASMHRHKESAATNAILKKLRLLYAGKSHIYEALTRSKSSAVPSLQKRHVQDPDL